MARARNIKPGFFSNDSLADVPALGRLLFIGLWTLADRDGRLEDRPRRIKAEILPYDDCDVDALLDALQARGFIRRYSVGGSAFIQVLTFAKHQNPHVKEAASVIPAPDEHSACTVQAPGEAQPKPERAGLIPDSGFLIPETIEQAASQVPTSQHEPKPPAAALPDEPGEGWTPPPEADASPNRAAQIAVLLRRNGADPRIHPSAKGIAELVATKATDTQILQALATAKQRRTDQGSAQPVTVPYLLPIVAELREGPPPRASPGKPQKFDPSEYVNRDRISRRQAQETSNDDPGIIDVEAVRVG